MHKARWISNKNVCFKNMNRFSNSQKCHQRFLPFKYLNSSSIYYLNLIFSTLWHFNSMWFVALIRFCWDNIHPKAARSKANVNAECWSLNAMSIREHLVQCSHVELWWPFKALSMKAGSQQVLDLFQIKLLRLDQNLLSFKSYFF